MASFNKVVLMGNLTRDPQMKYLPSNTPVVEFGIAVSRKFKSQSGEDREDVAFIDCSAFARTAEVVNEHFRKGKPIFIEGRLKLDQWEDKQGGGKRSKLSVVVENFQFVGGKDDGGERGSDSRPAPARAGALSQQRPPANEPFDEGGGIRDEDIPF